VIYTVGHSTRSLDELVQVLQEARVRELVDVRRAPGSRRHPQFAARALAQSLQAAGVSYSHEQGLGGFRRARADSPNRGWSQEAFAGYADHMSTAEFATALDRVQGVARERPTCVMCAEAQWWRCHRRLIADALLVRGWEVMHLGLGREPVAHELTRFAVREGAHGLIYPPAQGELGAELAPLQDASQGDV